jgi:hypothetical protein
VTKDELAERLEREYPAGSFGAEIVQFYRDATRLMGREQADKMAAECFSKLDAARDKSLRMFFSS